METTLTPNKTVDINLLQHEILRTLREIGVMFSKIGNDVEGHRAVYYYSPGSGRLQFGLLVGLLNGYKYVDPNGRNNPFLNTARINFEDVEIRKYDWEEVAKAIEILSFNKYVEDQIQRQGDIIEDRFIRLLPAGLLAYNTHYHLREKEKEETELLLFRANLTTEAAVRETAKATKNLYWATLAIAVITLIVGLVPVFKDNGKDAIQQRLTTIEQQLQSLQKQRSQPANVLSPKKAAKD